MTARGPPELAPGVSEDEEVEGEERVVGSEGADDECHGATLGGRLY